MSEKAKPVRDAFAFSLGGLTAITSFVAAPAIADDLINKIRDEQLFQLREDQPDTAQEMVGIKGRFWVLGRRRAA